MKLTERDMNQSKNRSMSQNKPNFLRVEALEYRNSGSSEETHWKLEKLTTSESEAKEMLKNSIHQLRVVECTANGRIVVDSNREAA